MYNSRMQNLPKAPLLFIGVFILGLGLSLTPNRLNYFAQSFIAPKDRETFSVPAEFDFSREKKKLERLLEEKGIEDAVRYYLLLDGEAYRTKDAEKVRIAHDLAHFIGDELYKRQGAKGVILCYGDSGFGCYHGFYARAVNEEGRELINTTEQDCASRGVEDRQFHGCVHGLGHGILAIEGYEFDELLKALEECELLKLPFGKEGCRSGVFMEYNNRQFELYLGNEAVVRELDPNNPYEPCSELAEKYQYDCYYEQPNWWRGAVNHDFALMGKWCSGIESRRGREACFVGIGRTQPLSTQYNLEKMGENCSKMPTYEGMVLCIGEATRLLATLLHEHTLDPLLLCDWLKDKEREECRNKVNRYIEGYTEG